MTRSKKASEPRKWKRRRGRIVEERLRSGRAKSIVNVDWRLRLSTLVENALMPLLFAQTARTLGCPFVSPTDFYCGCLPCAKDGLPICEGVKPDCRYAGRWTAEKAAAAETDKALKEYQFRFDLARSIFNAENVPKLIRQEADRTLRG